MSPSERTLRYLSELEQQEWPQSLRDYSDEREREGSLELYYDRDGEPLSFMQWMLLYHDEYKLVAQETIGPLLVSTVWLGIDRGFGFTHLPVIFETMVFDTRGEGLKAWDGVEQERYYTEAEALAGHERICEQVRLLEELR